jgi:hypothetical protein
MIAGCHNISASGQELIADFGRDTKPARSVFAVYDNEIQS